MKEEQIGKHSKVLEKSPYDRTRSESLSRFCPDAFTPSTTSAASMSWMPICVMQIDEDASIPSRSQIRNLLAGSSGGDHRKLSKARSA
ncbi:hypothetical protein PROFUN_13431 [Planoprotostelium fungivorum]|uniref:Uncharacterized protein n=1 Tax=Planoprotostelium fungivorum TaxID=1890364 RepID=A0A2P6N430_9EUKA|nr:hypothetical protein PROFUN_13431 [Planoprotostelium fungivorum]